MTRLFINSTNPDIVSRMKPEVFRKILEKRKALEKLLKESLQDIERVTLEIGCGHGHFLTDYGRNHPREHCVGIDVNRGRIFKARKKVERAGIANVQFFDCDGLEFLSILPPGTRIKSTWVLFPDPWPKKRHFKNRIIQPEFLLQLPRVPSPEGRLYLRSDYEPYLEWSRELLKASGLWKLPDSHFWPEMTATVFQELTGNCHYSLVAELQQTKQPHQKELPKQGNNHDKTHGKRKSAES